MKDKPNNLVAKYARKYNKAAVHKDRKKAMKKGERKHKGNMDEKLSAKDDAGKWVTDFRKSDAPQFIGKSDKKKQKMAIAAYLSAKDDAKKEACWQGYTQKGMKKKGNKVVPNCVPEETTNEWACNRTETTRLVKGGDKRKKYMKARLRREAEMQSEDLRKWFGKGKKGDWVRVGTDGDIKGDCAREPGEGKPKCMPRDKAHSMSKKDRGSAARRKRAKDPTVDRPGTGNKPIMVKTDKNESLEEKNVPTKPKLWAKFKAQAKSKFDVYPSAYANGWAAKQYKAAGGGWKTQKESVSEETISEMAMPRKEFEKLKKGDKLKFTFDSSMKKGHQVSLVVTGKSRSAKYDVDKVNMKDASDPRNRTKFALYSRKGGDATLAWGDAATVMQKYVKESLDEAKRFKFIVRDKNGKVTGGTVTDKEAKDMAKEIGGSFERADRPFDIKGLSKMRKESAQDRLSARAAKHGLGKPNKAADDYMAKMKAKHGDKKVADMKAAGQAKIDAWRKAQQQKESILPVGAAHLANRSKSDSGKKTGFSSFPKTDNAPKTKFAQKIRKRKQAIAKMRKEETDLQERPMGQGYGNTTYLSTTQKKKAMQNPKVAKRVADVQKREKERKAGMSFMQKMKLKKQQRQGQIKRHQSNNDRADDVNRKTGRIESAASGTSGIEFGPRPAARKTVKVRGADGHTKVRLQPAHHGTDQKESVNELTKRDMEMMAKRKQANLVKRGKAKPAPKKPTQKKPEANINTVASKQGQDDNLIMQLRKAQDKKGKMKVKFRGGETELPLRLIDRLLATYDKAQRPQDKKKLVNMITHELRKRAGLKATGKASASDKAMKAFQNRKGIPAPKGKGSKGPTNKELRDIERGK